MSEYSDFDEDGIIRAVLNRPEECPRCGGRVGVESDGAYYCASGCGWEHYGPLGEPL